MITPTVFGQARATNGPSRAALRLFARLVREGQPDLLHQAAERLRDCLVAVPGCVKASRPGDREPGHNALTTRLLCHHDDSRLAAYCRPAR